MKEYKIILEQFKADLLKLSNQTITDLKGILLNQIITYQFKRTNSDIVAYFFEYDFELLGLTFYGLDKNLDQYTEHILLPTKFPSKNWTTITKGNIYRFENEKAMKRYENELSEQEKNIFNKFLEKRLDVFENWFYHCWNETVKNVELKKDAYFSIHDTYYLTELKTMKEIQYDEIKEKYK